MVSRDPRRKPTADELLADALSQFYDDALGYVMFAWPWDDPSFPFRTVKLPEKYRERFPGCEYGPDLWACEFLDEVSAEVHKRKFDGHSPVDPIRFSTASGHGIGKSVLVAFLIKWIMDTRPMCHGTVTAGTADQLRTKTWATLGQWHAYSITEGWYDFSATRGHMMLKHKQHPLGWFCSAQTCKEENSEAFAGQHAANSTSFYIFDEASGVPDKIYEVREGGLTDGEPMVFDFGNPTKNTGQFYENTSVNGKFAHRYIRRMIDSRDVTITNKKKAQELIDDYGLDSDVVKVRVRGMFPSADNLQFLGMEEVRLAQVRPVFQDRHAPLIIGVDVARRGKHNSVIYARLGDDARSYFNHKDDVFNGLNGIQLAEKIIAKVNFFRQFGISEYNIFIDGSGGYGGSPADYLQHVGYNCVEINFGSGASDKDNYRFKSDEMWGRMRNGIRTRLCISDDDALYTQLTQRQFGYMLGSQRISLESKEDMEERLGGEGSPDEADALALTFALDVAPRQLPNAGEQKGLKVIGHDYDPYSSQAMAN